MAAFSKWGGIAVVAGTMGLLSVEAVHLESPKTAPAVEKAEETKRAAEKATEKTVEQKQQEAKAAAQRSKAPKMAPQFDGLNFYETFIGASQR